MQIMQNIFDQQAEIVATPAALVVQWLFASLSTETQQVIFTMMENDLPILDIKTIAQRALESLPDSYWLPIGQWLTDILSFTY